MRNVYLILALIPLATAWRSAEKHTYGKPCTNGTVSEGSKVVKCDETGSLWCAPSGKCECIQRDAVAVFVPEKGACLLLPFLGNEYRCISDQQCKMSTYGEYSRCNEDQGRCECYHPNSETELAQTVCFTKKRGLSASDLYPNCMRNEDCTQSNLGRLSRCNLVQMQCECYDTIANGKSETGYYDGECVYKRAQGDFCTSDKECLVFQSNTKCSSHETAFPGEKSCQCLEGGCGSRPGAGSALVGSFIVTLMASIFYYAVTHF